MAIDIGALTESYPGFKTHWGMDEFLFSAQGNDLNHSTKADDVDGSGFGTRVKNNLAGMQEGNLKIKGLAAMGKGKVNSIISQRFGRSSPVNVWFATQGLNALAPITFQPSTITDSSVSAKLKDSVEFDLELKARGAYNNGFIMLSPKTLLSGASGTGPTDDNTLYGGATTFGGAGQIHLWTLAGGTTPSLTFKIQHSTNGTTWTDLITFTAMTAIGSLRFKLPSTTVVNAFLQCTWTATGTPTEVQALAMFARDTDLDA